MTISDDINFLAQVMIDVWDTENFDTELMTNLRANAQLIRDYIETDQRLTEEREASGHRMPHGHNPYGSAYMAFVEGVGHDVMQKRTIRAWHYTRLVDAEVSDIVSGGIHVSTLQTLRRRLDAQVSAKMFSAPDADAIYAASPFHEQKEIRSGKFWMTSDPVCIDDSGVELLLGHWGGEAAYFWLRDQRLTKLVAAIGRPRVVEVAISIANTNKWYSAGKAVVAAYTKSLGCRPDGGAFDLYSMTDLGPEAVLAIHTEGEEAFDMMACGYPSCFHCRS